MGVCLCVCAGWQHESKIIGIGRMENCGGTSGRWRVVLGCPQELSESPAAAFLLGQQDTSALTIVSVQLSVSSRPSCDNRHSFCLFS